ncbi:Hypothetical protein, putative [Bodo saltans]|uniref:Uncharacterized protein n=1 Tax=Bodo saltans TaxID=75058 RepID=A0A0S4IMW4_BODSA|nr:Hypothetical protein, putative [Bodo saltans]|eukprot:CUF55215.1 Hypothetical protein, putative [Bodo saltans]
MNTTNVGSVQMSKNCDEAIKDSTATKNEKINVGQTFRKMLVNPKEAQTENR